MNLNNPRVAAVILAGAAVIAVSLAGVPLAGAIDTTIVVAPDSGTTTTIAGGIDTGSVIRGGCDPAVTNNALDQMAAQCNDPAWLASACGKTAQAAANCAKVAGDYNTLMAQPGTTLSIRSDGNAFVPTNKSQQLNIPVTSIVTPKTWVGWETKARREAALTMAVPLPGVPAPSPATFVRTKSWLTNGPNGDGQGVDSCEEYVYESFYDLERWIDASNVCARNDRCAVDMAFFGYDANTGATNTYPGIAGRLLKNRAGEYLTERYLYNPSSYLDANDVTHALAKNDFFAGSAAYFNDHMRNAFVAAGQGAYYDAVLLHLRKGALYYGIAPSPAAVNGNLVLGKGGYQQGFRNRWDFHDTLRKRTQGSAQEVLEDFRLRRAQHVRDHQAFEDLSGCGTFGAITKAELACGGSGALTFPTIQKGLDTMIWQYDPFTRLALRSGGLATKTLAYPATLQFALENNLDLGNYYPTFMSEQLTRVQTARAVSAGAYSSLSSSVVLGQVYLNAFANQQHQGAVVALNNNGAMSYGSIGEWPGNNEPPILKENIYSSYFWGKRTFPIVLIDGLPMLDCAGDASSLPVSNISSDDTGPRYDSDYPARQALCRYMNSLLREYNRLQKNQPSCLNTASSDCDWTPFEARTAIESQMLTAWDRQREDEYRFCRMLTGGGQVNPHDPANQLNVTIGDAERTSVKNFRAALVNRYKSIADTLKAIPRKEPNVFGKTYGDKEVFGTDLFNAHYDFTLGWEARLYPMKYDAQKICQVGGALGGNASAGITVFGATCELFDVELGLRGNDSTTGTNDGKAYVIAHANVLGFGTDPNNLSWTYELFEPIKEEWDINSKFGFQSDNEESTDLFRQDFQIWYFTVTIRVGIGVRYGGFGEFETKMPNADCASTTDPSPVLFQASAKVGPYVALFAIADVGVSVAHIIGVGVEVELTILSVSLPIHTTARIAQRSDGLWFEAEAGLDLDIGTLDGKLKGYVEIFGGKIKKEIVAWKGLHDVIPVFQTPTAAIPFGVVGVAGSMTLDEAGNAPLPSYYSNY